MQARECKGILSPLRVSHPIVFGEVLVTVGRTYPAAQHPLRQWLREHETASNRQVLEAEWAAVLDAVRKLHHGVLIPLADGANIDDRTTWRAFILADGSASRVPDSEDASHWDLVHVAAWGYYHALKHMLDAGHPVDSAAGGPKHKVTPLSLGARFLGDTNTECVRLLLDRGANIDHAEADGTTALINAACFGNVPVAKLLLERGASRKYRGLDGLTAEEHARRRHDDELADLIRGLQAEGQSSPMLYSNLKPRKRRRARRNMYKQWSHGKCVTRK